MVNEQDVKKFHGEWFVWLDLHDVCECGIEASLSGWYNIDKAMKKIVKQEGQTVLKVQKG